MQVIQRAESRQSCSEIGRRFQMGPKLLMVYLSPEEFEQLRLDQKTKGRAVEEDLQTARVARLTLKFCPPESVLSVLENLRPG